MRGLEGVAIMFAVIFALGMILVFVLFLLNLQNALKEVSEKNREVPPANVWLMFIPLFNIIYPFILYPRICDSIKKEYATRGLEEQGDFGRAIGITMPILGLCGVIPVLGVLAAMANFILLIVFWVKIAGYKDKLRMTPKGDGNSLGANPDLLDG